MNQRRFSQVLKKYIKGTASMEEKDLIEEWYDALEQKSQVEVEHRPDLEKTYWMEIENKIGKTDSRKTIFLDKVNRTPWITYSMGIAATIAIFFLAFQYYIGTQPVGHTKDVAVLSEQSVVKTPSSAVEKQDKRMTLPDGSIITLAANSTIRLASDFNQSTREVYLEGEAFFDVAHDKTRPFLVYANGVTTKVLGTSFTIKAFKKEKNVTVSVRTGRVSVLTKSQDVAKHSDEVVLTPNQNVVYDVTEQRLSLGLVEVPQPVISAEEIQQLRFDDASVKEIFLAMEKIYGIDIVFDESAFSACTLTTSISNEGLFNRLDIIASAIGVSYEVKGTDILIRGSGCN